MTTPLEGEAFEVDNGKVWSVLKDLMLRGPVSVYISHLDWHLPLHPKHDTHFFHAKNSTGLGTPTICKQRCIGTPEMLLLPSPMAMDFPWLPSHELDH